MGFFTKSVAAFCLGAGVQAGLTEMWNRLEIELNMRQNMSGHSISRRDTEDGKRNLKDHILQEYFLPYGCWCHFDENKYNIAGKGRGTPMDDWDANCRKLSEGYECAVMDGVTDGEDCLPWEVPYETAGFGMSAIAVPIHCGFVSNGNKCAERACLVETFFVNRLADFIIPNQPPGFANIAGINTDYLHSSGFKNAECPINLPPRNGANGGQGRPQDDIVDEPKQCCGAYPDRFPYKTMSGDRRCCQSAADGAGKTFNPFTNVCCADGTIGSFGSAC